MYYEVEIFMGDLKHYFKHKALSTFYFFQQIAIENNKLNIKIFCESQHLVN